MNNWDSGLTSILDYVAIISDNIADSCKNIILLLLFFIWKKLIIFKFNFKIEGEVISRIGTTESNKQSSYGNLVHDYDSELIGNAEQCAPSFDFAESAAKSVHDYHLVPDSVMQNSNEIPVSPQLKIAITVVFIYTFY